MLRFRDALSWGVSLEQPLPLSRSLSLSLASLGESSTRALLKELSGVELCKRRGEIGLRPSYMDNNDRDCHSGRVKTIQGLESSRREPD